MHKDATATSTSQASLRAVGLRVTPCRQWVLQILEEAQEALSVARIVQRVQGRFDQATVYRTLATLKAAGLVRQIEWQHGHAHFELVSLPHHHHVICRQCERVAVVHECVSAQLQNHVLVQSGFAQIQEHSLEFFGLCQACSG